MEQVEQKESKFKKWGWWAVAGLVGVLVIAGLIIAVTTSGPKPSTEVAQADENNQQEANEETKNPEEDKKEEKPTQQATPELPAITESPSADLPKTGPEDSIVPILSAGVIGYILALGINYGANTLRRRN